MKPKCPCLGHSSSQKGGREYWGCNSAKPVQKDVFYSRNILPMFLIKKKGTVKERVLLSFNCSSVPETCVYRLEYILHYDQKNNG